MTPEEKENTLRAQARRCAEEITKAMSVKMTGDDMNTDLTNIKHFLNYTKKLGFSLGFTLKDQRLNVVL
ncbi:TPA: hypothetical protein ACYENP_000240 [Klebsiella michiganensis]